ncbi:MAG TPA: hypothetical protein VK208_09340 [Pyrinomonadaceae bacterium]|jgi:hypothetical protein|nr:hypothetical protein [Pyrinomonadaceae bacterium]
MDAKPGDLLRVRAFGGKEIVRCFVEERGKTVLICPQAEYERAQKENRAPDCIGWPKADVIEVETAH